MPSFSQFDLTLSPPTAAGQYTAHHTCMCLRSAILDPQLKTPPESLPASKHILESSLIINYYLYKLVK